MDTGWRYNKRSYVTVLLVTLLLCLATGIGTAQAESSVVTKRSSSATAVTTDGQFVLAVNPDSNSLSILSTATQKRIAEIPVGLDPRTVSVNDAGTRACVTNRGSDDLSIIDLTARTEIARVPVGHMPWGVVLDSLGKFAFVANEDDASVSLVDVPAARVVTEFAVKERPTGLALAADGYTLYVTHLLSGEVTVLTLQPFAVYLPLIIKGHIAQHATRNTGHVSRFTFHSSLVTIPTWPDANLSQSVVLSPDGKRAYLPQTRSNTANRALTFDTTVFAVVSVIDTQEKRHLIGQQISLPEADRPVGLPFDACFTPDGKQLWIVNTASNDLSVINMTTGLANAHIRVSDNPRGIVVAPDGQKAYVNNTLAGTVSVIDTGSYTVTGIITGTAIPLPPALLHGKRLFHSSARPDLARQQWISCNTCHFEGEHDGRTWFFGFAGPRNTTSLLGMIETYPLRWSGEWNESADSEFAIRMEQFGTGLIQGEMYDTRDGPPNQGRSWDLDCLALFIDSLQCPLNPKLGPGGSLSAPAQRGRAVFNRTSTQCSLCHPAPLYTDLLSHDVGTAVDPGEKLGPAFDTPSLRSLYRSAPYLHDGSAASLRDVLTTANAEDKHGITSDLTTQELDDLVAFLLELPYPSEAEPFTYQVSTCQGSSARGPARIEIWVEGHDILMAHHEASYNCCARIGVYLEDQRPLLKLIEQESYPDSQPCRCVCPYEITARIADLPLGTYRVEVWNGAAEQRLAQAEVTVR